jgi:cytoskeletal protein CcmA (bactofilin family)
MDADKPTLIDAETEVQGKLTGKDARVLGKFRGEIELSGRLFTGPASLVEARLRADGAELAGEFRGEIAVRSLLLLEKARVEGTVDTQVLAVREGAQLNGAVSAGTPPKAKPVAAAPHRPASGVLAG